MNKIKRATHRQPSSTADREGDEVVEQEATGSSPDTATDAIFSPATFYDVVASTRGPGPTEEPLGTLGRPAIITFYGFRGGAGRTVALAHAAVALARRGLGVAAVDLDLEAPGLHTVLGVKSSPGAGAVFLLREAFLADAESRARLDAAPHIVRVPDVDDLWVVPAGAIDTRYLATLEELNLPGWHLSGGAHPLRVVAQAIQRTVAKLDRRKVLDELNIPKSAAFAEELPQGSIADLFVKSSRHSRIEDPHSTLIIGAKGAGKSLFWRWLIRQPVDARRFVAGHAPRRAIKTEGGPLTLSPDALKELERFAQMSKNGTHKSFWTFYALARIAYAEPDVRELSNAHSGGERTVLRALLEVDDARSLQKALIVLLKMPSAGTLAEQSLSRADEILEAKQRPKLTLVYDGLDDGFDVGEDAEAMQRRYVVALLQLLGDVRGRYAWVALKVFLREDIWEASALQNRSHLEAGRVDLRWETHDLWQMALRLVGTSKTYASAVVFPPSNSTDIDDLERALEPLWGRFISGKQTARTANYVKNRMADGLGRFFPRTLVQMLETAVEYEKRNRDDETGRVVRLRSLQQGIEQASSARVKDLETEYTILGQYLRLFSREQPTGSPTDFRDRLQRKYASSMRSKKGAKKTRGVEAGALHAGPGGWMKVVDFLQTVGVLGPRDGRDDKLQVALLYRPGLGIPSYGG